MLSDVRGLAIRKKSQLAEKIRIMAAMSRALGELIETGADEDRPLGDWPILTALESSPANQLPDRREPCFVRDSPALRIGF